MFLAACVWHMCLVMCSNTRKAQSKTLLCIAKQKHCLSVQIWGGKVEGGGGGGAGGRGRCGAGPCQLSALSEPISTNRLCQLRDGT